MKKEITALKKGGKEISVAGVSPPMKDDHEPTRFSSRLEKKTVKPPPLWLMRQAGRYLPEYREARKRHKDFLKLCADSDLTVELTLQPLRRFRFDAAIVFSDILTIPDALGQKVVFKEGIGPTLACPLDLDKLRPVGDPRFARTLQPAYDAIGRLATILGEDNALIGFAGAPWTLAFYMIGGGGEGSSHRAQKTALENARQTDALIDLLTEAVTQHLRNQIKAGADAVQIFDSWAGLLDHRHFVAWCVKPAQAIVAALRRTPSPRTGRPVPVIGFPRGAGTRFLDYAEAVDIDGLSLDDTASPSWARRRLGGGPVLQGNLNPYILLAGGEILDRAVDDILEAFADIPHIFNLSHGVLPETPVESVKRLVGRIRGGGA